MEFVIALLFFAGAALLALTTIPSDPDPPRLPPPRPTPRVFRAKPLFQAVELDAPQEERLCWVCQDPLIDNKPHDHSNG